MVLAVTWCFISGCGGEEHCVVTCFCGREGSATLGNATLQVRRGLGNARGHWLLGWRLGKTIRLKEKMIEKVDGFGVDLKWPGHLSLQLLLHKFVRDQHLRSSDWPNAGRFSLQRSERTNVHVPARWGVAWSHGWESGGRELPCTKALYMKQNQGGSEQGSDTSSCSESKEGSEGLLAVWRCLPCGGHSMVYRNRKKRLSDDLEAFHCFWKKSWSTLVQREFALLEGKWKAGAGGSQPACGWEAWDEALRPGQVCR